MINDLFRGTEPQVVTTNADDPFEGRVFIWAWTEWFERVEGEWGNVAFSPVARSEPDLSKWLSESGDDDLVDADEETAATVKSEFLEQEPLYPEGGEVYDEVGDLRQEEGDFEHR